MEKTKSTPKKFPAVVTKIFYNKIIMKNLLTFLEEKSKTTLKNCFQKTGWKDRKKQIKEMIKKYIIDFGKHQEKFKYRLNDEGSLVITTNIFNINKDYLKFFTHVFHKESKDVIELEKEDLYGYLKVLPKFEFYLTDNRGDYLKLSKALIPYDTVKDPGMEDDTEDSNKKYEMFYNETNLTNDLSNFDFSNKELLIERQKMILEKMNAEKNQIFYPLQFISEVNYWCIILCHGGYFACGFFLKDKVIDHKSDHKYVVRKKAGQRQIAKDKSKKIKTSSKIIVLILINSRCFN
jgi:hypothetical protein